jgi:hypothetical protein
MIARFKLLVIVLLGFALSACQKDELYAPKDNEPAVKVESVNIESVNVKTDNYSEIVDPDDNEDDEDSDGKGRR